jgi:hypothetical protein
MLRTTLHDKNRKVPTRKVRFKGIVADAIALKVNRATLYRMLTGEWNLPGLRKRYAALKGGNHQ